MNALASLLLGALVLVSAACSRPATAIVVVIESELAVPAELASVRAEVGGAACNDATCTHDFALTDASSVPFSFTVTPTGEGRDLALVVRGRDPSSADRVVRSVHSEFVTGRTLLLRVTLDRACIDATSCGDGSTCIAGACTSDRIDASTLHDVVPGTELHLDGGTRDDAGSDTGVDADVVAPDTGTIPRTCHDVPVTTPSGAFMIDPDGAGGSTPFLAYCETSADGGGWTLIAKVDPSNTMLGFDAPAWTGTPGAASGAADLSVGNALYLGYWSIQVNELRIVMAPVATPTATRTLVTSLGSPVVLRSAMEASAHVTLDAPRAAWATLIGAPDPGAGMCERVGVPAELPATTPALHVRIGYVWGDTAGCAQPGFWAGLGASGTSCHAVGSVSGGGRICGTGAQRQDYPLAAWLFAR